MYKILDELEELIYITNPKDYTLLFINKFAREQLKFYDELTSETKCYKVFHNLDSPCSNCKNSRLSKNHSIQYKIYNPLSNKHFVLNDKIIEWQDKNGNKIDAKIQISHEITDEVMALEQISRTAKTEAFIINCIKELHKNMNLDAAIRTMLCDVGKFVEASRTYIYTFDFASNTMHLTHEWCDEGISSTSSEMKNCSMNVISRWMPYFRSNNYMYIDDVELYSKYIDEYRMLKEENVESLMSVPLVLESGELIGFLGIDNFSPKITIQHIQLICDTLSYFIISMLERQLIEQKLEEQSFTDSLTQIKNRNKFMSDIDDFNLNLPLENFGIAYVDMNGLKTLNDNKGHAAGDSALKSIANILCTLFDLDYTYRIGGDEFVALVPNVLQEDFELKIKKLQEFSGVGNHPSISIGSKWFATISNLDKNLKAVDELMYEDKKQFYINNKIERRKN